MRTYTSTCIFSHCFVLSLLKNSLDCLTFTFHTLTYLYFAQTRHFFMILTRLWPTNRWTGGHTLLFRCKNASKNIPLTEFSSVFHWLKPSPFQTEFSFSSNITCCTIHTKFLIHVLRQRAILILLFYRPLMVFVRGVCCPVLTLQTGYGCIDCSTIFSTWSSATCLLMEVSRRI